MCQWHVFSQKRLAGTEIRKNLGHQAVSMQGIAVADGQVPSLAQKKKPLLSTMTRDFFHAFRSKVAHNTRKYHLKTGVERLIRPYQTCFCVTERQIRGLLFAFLYTAKKLTKPNSTGFK